MQFECLFSKNLKDYYLAPIPVTKDHEISDLLRNWASLNERSRRETIEEFSEPSYYDTLVGYSSRMAGLAVRTRNPEFILLGLLAFGAHPRPQPWHDKLHNLALHIDAVERIGVNVGEVFENAARLLPYEHAEIVRHFVTRHDKAIDIWGYYASVSGNGFRYRQFMDLHRKRKWPEDEQEK